MALVPILCLLLPEFAQVAHGEPRADAAAPDSRSDANFERGKPSNIFINTHDVSGKLGTPLLLKFEFIRTGEVSIDAIHLLGLPRGVTISDSTNTFSPSDDKPDVNIIGWDLQNIQITQTDERESSFPLAVAAIWAPEPDGQVNVATSLLNVNFLPNTPDHTVTSAGGAPRGPETPTAGTRGAPSATPVFAKAAVPDAAVATEGAGMPSSRGTPSETAAVIDRPVPPAVVKRRPAAEGDAGRLAQPVGIAPPAPQVDTLVERARGLIRLGDISGARLLLERAQARNAPNATFLLAQTWDPAMLRRWNVRGLRADPDLARNLYAKAAGQNPTDERLLAAMGR